MKETFTYDGKKDIYFLDIRIPMQKNLQLHKIDQNFVILSSCFADFKKNDLLQKLLTFHKKIILKA